MEEKNELNDIILNRSSGNSGMKKVMLAVASLAILLIVVVVIMSTLNPEDEAKLPQAIETPEASESKTIEDDPLFEPVAIDDTTNEVESLNDVAKKIKEQSQEDDAVLISGPEDIFVEEETEVVVPAKYEKPTKKVAKAPAKKQTKKVVKKPTHISKTGKYFVQVGSFGRFSPDKKFLKKITDNGYTYKFHEVTVNGKKITKVLVGPYSTDKAARQDIKGIRSKIEPGAFLSRI